MIRILLLCLLSIATSAHSSLISPTSLQSVQDSTQCLDTCYNRSVVCSETRGDSCPSGLFCKEGHCECGVYPHNIITCNGTSSSLLNYFCATFDEDNNVMLVGHCPHRRKSENYTLYYNLPRNVSTLSILLCQPFNRTGALCGRCLPEHYPLAYSFNMTCISCPHVHWNWARYIMAAYLPLTLFYLVILFKINATSSHYFAAVYFCQAITMPIVLRILLQSVLTPESGFTFAAKLLASLYGIWNLDFFRPFYSHLCLGIDILPTLALDYVIAVYPLLLMIISYLLIVLYDRNYRVVTILWRPFRILFSFLKSNWNIRTSVIDAYATFFFLSYVKFLSVSSDLLTPTKVYHLHGDHYNSTWALYYAGDIEYFGKEHLPYGILAIIMLFFFVIFPTIVLAIYPFQLFQKFLNLFPVRWYILHTFMDSIQGCYKDGTEPGTRDCRWFASIFIFIRFSQFMLYSFLIPLTAHPFAAMTLILQVILIAIIQPFKASFSHYNTINVVFSLGLTLVLVVLMGNDMSSLIKPELNPLFASLCVILGVFPLVYVAISMFHWIYTHHKKFTPNLILRFRGRRQGYDLLAETLPDRMENSSQYHKGNLASFASQQ